MPDYNYPDDGKLHTRLSELIRCTPGQIHRVVAERFGDTPGVKTKSMLAGTERHAMWQSEAERTRRVPRIFGVDWVVTHVEQEFASEIFPGVILHSRPDIVCASMATIPDFKTVVDGAKGWRENIKSYYQSSKQRQLRIYGYQAGLHGIRITDGAFLCEVWNKEYTEILGHEIVKFPIHLSDIAADLSSLKPRIELLRWGVEGYLAHRSLI